ncbi:DUF4438 domain-containing protein [Mycoplasmatota bacterium]|nr:DUF4438 domain-containing protein [Mycoplasmatota bacterium]
MIKTNKELIVMQAVQGQVSHPKVRQRVTAEGKTITVPNVGGITYGVHVGDDAFGLMVDHLEPAVSMKNTDKVDNVGLMTLACPGNYARVISGEAKGDVGYVLGTHGGIDHTIVEFAEETLEKMVIGDKILVKGHGKGLVLHDYPNVDVISIDPELLEKIDIEEENGKVVFPVVAKIPGAVMGSGVGSGTSHSGDYDIITHDRALMNELGIDKLKFGDFVLLEDSDNTYGLGGYFRGASTIGIIVHSDCLITGHGPGVTVVMTSKKGDIVGKIDPTANIGKYIKESK